MGPDPGGAQRAVEAKPQQLEPSFGGSGLTIRQVGAPLPKRRASYITMGCPTRNAGDHQAKLAETDFDNLE